MSCYQAGSLFAFYSLVSLRNLQVSLPFPNEICTSGNWDLRTELEGRFLPPQHPVASKLGEKWEIIMLKCVNWKASGCVLIKSECHPPNQLVRNELTVSRSFPYPRLFSSYLKSLAQWEPCFPGFWINISAWNFAYCPCLNLSCSCFHGGFILQGSTLNWEWWFSFWLWIYGSMRLSIYFYEYIYTFLHLIKSPAK